MTICIYLYLSVSINSQRMPMVSSTSFCCLESTKPDITSSLVEIFPPPSLSKWSKTAFQAAALAEVAERFGCNMVQRIELQINYKVLQSPILPSMHPSHLEVALAAGSPGIYHLTHSAQHSCDDNENIMLGASIQLYSTFNHTSSHHITPVPCKIGPKLWPAESKNGPKPKCTF